MGDNDEENNDRKAQKPVWVENFIKRLESEGFIRWDSCTWIKPEDIPVFIAKGKIKRSRKRRAILMAERAEASMQGDS